MVFAVMHTSASLTINENASSDVPLDLNVSFTVLAWGTIRFFVFLQITMPAKMYCAAILAEPHTDDG